jgi:hypothetical protein
VQAANKSIKESKSLVSGQDKSGGFILPRNGLPTSLSKSKKQQTSSSLYI